jgi:hypothetical protein
MMIDSENAWYSSPKLRSLYYIRGILRNRLYYMNEDVALRLLLMAVNRKVDIEELKELALWTKNWTEWRVNMEEIIRDGDD